MSSLSWSGVRHLHQILSDGDLQVDDVCSRLSERQSIRPTTARGYLRTATRLGLICVVEREVALASRAATPVSMLLNAPLLRLGFLLRSYHGMKALARRLNSEALRASLGSLGVESTHLFTIACGLSRQLKGHYALSGSPRPMILLECARIQLLGRTKRSRTEPHVWTTLDAFEVYQGFVGDRVQATSSDHERFIVDCMTLYKRRSFQLNTAQHLLPKNQPFHVFSSRLGYLKSISTPTVFEEVEGAESVQATGEGHSSRTALAV